MAAILDEYETSLLYCPPHRGRRHDRQRKRKTIRPASQNRTPATNLHPSCGSRFRPTALSRISSLTYDSFAVDGPLQEIFVAVVVAEKLPLQELATSFSRLPGVEGRRVSGQDPPGVPRELLVEGGAVQAFEAAFQDLHVLQIDDGDGIVHVELLPQACVRENLVDLAQFGPGEGGGRRGGRVEKQSHKCSCSPRPSLLPSHA